MSLAATLAGALAGTLLLTTALRLASDAGWTRIDLPFLLGTMLTDDRSRARRLGYLVHAAAGLGFGLVYAGVFAALGRGGALLGALLGLLHGLVAGTAVAEILVPLAHRRIGSPSSAAHVPALLEPTGFLMLNYGRLTPAVSLAAHAAYGALVGWAASL